MRLSGESEPRKTGRHSGSLILEWRSPGDELRVGVLEAQCLVGQGRVDTGWPGTWVWALNRLFTGIIYYNISSAHD